MLKDVASLEKENEILQERLSAVEATLDAIRKGDVDAIVVSGPTGDQLYTLLSPEHPYQFFIENMKEAALIVSKDGTIFYANIGFTTMVGHQSERVIGTNILDFVKESQKPIFLNSLENAIKKNLEFGLITSQRKILTVSLSTFSALWNEKESYYILMNDITKLKRDLFIAEVSQFITKILSEAASLKIAIHQILAILNKYFGWEVIVVTQWNKEKQTLETSEIAHLPGMHIESFIKKTQEMEIQIGLISHHAAFTCRPYWLENVQEEESFYRREEAIKSNIRGALAFPYFFESAVRGTIELFKKTPFIEEVDDLFLNVITKLGIEFGLYLQRIISEQTKAEFATVIHYSASGIYSTDKNGIVKSWNPSTEKIYGWTATEMIGNSIEKIYPPERMHEFVDVYMLLNQGKIIEQQKTQAVRKDGTRIWVNKNFSPIQDSSGNVTGACIVFEDISTQKTMLESLGDTQEKLKGFVETTEEWFWMIDLEGNFTFSNQAVLDILGYPSSEVVGKNILYFLAAEDRENMKQFLSHKFQEKKGWHHEPMRFLKKNGEECWMESNGLELLGRDWQIKGFRGANRDVTASKNLEKIKHEFISVVSHELRTPLTSIKGALTLINSTELNSEEKTELLKVAQRNADRLGNIVNDLLDIERIQLGKFSLEFKKINLKDVVFESLAASEIVAKKFSINFKKENTFPDVQVNGDFSRLQQATMELFSNAIKFSPNHGTIYVSMEYNSECAKLSIRDEGKGIPKNFQEKIFDKFAQADASSIRARQGTGLGLNICKYIIEGHGGKIDYLTIPGKGTTFYYEIPIIKES